jgi:hypothetical protein
MATDSNRKDLAAWANDRRAEFEKLLKEFVETPSVSADPARKGDVRRCAELAVATVKRRSSRPRGIPWCTRPSTRGKTCRR